jgi:hypothetical protein
LKTQAKALTKARIHKFSFILAPTDSLSRIKITTDSEDQFLVGAIPAAEGCANNDLAIKHLLLAPGSSTFQSSTSFTHLKADLKTPHVLRQKCWPLTPTTLG